MTAMTGSSNLGTLAKALQQQEIGAQVVTKTLNQVQKQQQNGGTGSGSSYALQTEVLGAYAGVGSKVDVIV